MRYSCAILYLAFVGALAVPTRKRQITGPVVTVKNGTLVGSTSGIVDTFNGIPFAQPPVGSLRLRPPQTLKTGYAGGTLLAVGTPRSCPQQVLQTNTSIIPQDSLALLLQSPLFQTATNSEEDCLTLNVLRPSTATASSKLPVVVWIYGGAFEAGSTQMYDGTNLVQKSIALGHPIVFAEMNYRVSGFGFLQGKEMQKDGSTNLGLRDQRKALEWVQDNIAAFGGDPTKVTIWGESAGAISVWDQMIINSGNNNYKGKKLFRGAMMNSGSIVPAEPVSHPKAQLVYDTVVKAAGCSGKPDTLACLRSVDYLTFLNAVNALPGAFSYQGLSLAYLPRPDPMSTFFPVSPEVALLNDQYTKVPFIIGDQEDEGTLFAFSTANLTTTAQTNAYFANGFPETATEISNGYLATYPDDPAAGSPFRTGQLNNIYPQFKRIAAINGDVVFNLRRRQVLSHVSSAVPTWSYLDSHLYGTPALGTFHASDVLEYYFGVPSVVTAESFRTYFVSFVNFLNPNSISIAAPLINWPQYSTSSPRLLQFQAASNNLLPDTFRSNSFNYLQQYPFKFRT